MANLIYSAIMSLDGYIEDEGGGFDWAMPDEELHRFANDLERGAGAFLYGRRMYETMMVWETEPALAAESDVTRDYAEIWQAADKIVYSTTLREAATRRTTIQRSFDPAAVRRLKAASQRDLLIGGPNLAAHAFRAGLVDECQLLVVPAVVGGGKRGLPEGVRLDLTLLEQRRFGSGTVFLRYRINPGPAAGKRGVR